MRNINKILLGATVVAAGFATVGAGAGADFVDSPSVHQTVSTGTLQIDLTSNGKTAAATLGTPAALELAPLGPTSSSFSYVQTIIATNNGTVTGTVKDIQLTLTGDRALANDVLTVVTGPDWRNTCSGSAARCIGTNLTPGGSVTLAPGKSLEMHLGVYAGGASGWPALTNADQGKSLGETLTYTVSS
jgi:hypothetical protein